MLGDDDIRKKEFLARMDEFYSNGSLNSREQEQAREQEREDNRAAQDAYIAEIMAQLAIVASGGEPEWPKLGWTEAEVEALRAAGPKPQKIEPEWMSPYDRKFAERQKLRQEMKGIADPTCPAARILASRIADLDVQVKIELKRSTDDNYRELHRIDEYRAGPGREERNAARRNRKTANVMTPKAVLATETPEEKLKRLRDAAKERQRKARAAKRSDAT